MQTDLNDLTRTQALLQEREAAILTLVAKHLLGHYSEDPKMMHDFLVSRGVSPHVGRLVQKAVVPAGSTTDGTWAGPLAGASFGPILAAVDRQSVLGQLNAQRVPASRSVGAAQTVGGTAYWVGQAQAKPLTALGFAAFSLPVRKLAADVAVSIELIRTASVSILRMLERACVTAVSTELDSALLDPANAGIVDIKPASLTNGLVAVVPAGDFDNQLGQVLAGISGGAPTRPTLILSLQSALRLTALRDLAAMGVKVIVTPAAGNRLIAIDADGVAVSDDGGELRIGEPSLVMDDAPPTPDVAATVHVSAFQRNLKVIRCERWTNWSRRGDAVAYLTLA